MGTVALLDWARTLPGLKRFIYVSSGAVYKHHGPDRPGEPLPEDGYVMPRTLYGISKLASELITERYGELFGFSTTSVRLASVYGTMDRPTASRTFRHGPNKIAHMAVAGVKRVRVNTLDAVGDYIHVEDVARAVFALLRLDRVRYSAYNIAMGHTTRLGELVKWAAREVPGIPSRDHRSRRGGHCAGPGTRRWYVGCLRYLADQRGDRLEAAAGKRGAARLHGLDCE